MAAVKRDNGPARDFLGDALAHDSPM